MRTLGKHIIIECSGCRPEILNDLDAVQEILTNAAIAAKAEVRARAFHRFSPQGISGVVVISESHLSVHTWPEYGYAALDIYTCGEKTLPWLACEFVAHSFGATEVKATEIQRGIEKRTGYFSHKVSEVKEKNDVQDPQMAMVS